MILAVVVSPQSVPMRPSLRPPECVRHVVGEECSAHVPGGKKDSARTTLSHPCCRLRYRRKHSPQFGGVNRVVAAA